MTAWRPASVNSPAEPETIRFVAGRYGRFVTSEAEEPGDRSGLTPGELEALESAALGESVVGAGVRLGKSPWTIRTQRNLAMAKLGASNIVQAVYVAAKRNVI